MRINVNSQPILQVLEIGAGTGTFSYHYLEKLERWGKPYEFYFTDVSASFFSGAEKHLEKYLKHVTFQKLDMEVDPFTQGFCPHYFDLILAGDVLHVAKDIRRALGNIKSLLKPGGIIQIIETTNPDPRETQIFGILEGYWGFQDFNLRTNHPTLTPEKWEMALREVNFANVVATPLYNNSMSVIFAQLPIREYEDVNLTTLLQRPKHYWLIFYTDSNAHLCDEIQQKLAEINRQVITVKRPITCSEEGTKELVKSVFASPMENAKSAEGVIFLWGLQGDIYKLEQSQVSLPLVSLVQEMVTESKSTPRLYVITQETTSVDGYEVTNPTAGTLQGMVKSFSNEIPEIHISLVDLPPDCPVNKQADKIFSELWSNDKGSLIVAFRDGQRLLPRMVSTQLNNNDPLSLPSRSDRFQLLLPSTRLISDLEFGPLENYALGDREVEVLVKAVALNFRDVFVVLKPIPLFEEFNSVGLDIAGVVAQVGRKVTHFKVGDGVIGMNGKDNLSLPSHIKIEEDNLIPLPPAMTFQEGVTLPTITLSAVLGLVNIAKMKKGDTVLIHTASGGVGLCAIQLAKLVGAEIIATAGSKRKQNYLRNLGIQHVFHSRTTEFGNQILEVTNGRGVDIILNSITGEGFKEASLSALATNGRFVEMSRLNVWTPEEVKELRPDVLYDIMDLGTLGKSEIIRLMNQLKELLVSNTIQPIPYERFDALNIRGALAYLQKAKHIGKIVCMMPETRIENSKLTARTHLFTERSTYLVTGGLGGIGFEVVKWMLNSGAKHIAIASRHKPAPEVEGLIDSWNKAGKHVEAFPMDIGNYDQCHQLFHELKSPARGFPQLRGVMHAAGVLADASLENQNWSKFKQTYNPKVNGTLNLHNLTKDLILEHFVMFSSMAASFGTPFQANHAASNSFEDSLAANRRSIGLTATSVNWGNWGEVGVAKEIDIPGIRPISTSQGLLTLETIMKTQEFHLHACNIDSFRMAGEIFPTLRTYMDDKRLFGDLIPDSIINSDQFWKEVYDSEERDAKVTTFKNLIKSTLRRTLKMNQDEFIDDLTEFQTLGVDSLMMLELKNGLQNVLGSKMTLSANELKDCICTESLADRLVSSLLGEWHYVKNVLPTMDELQELILEDAVLPEHIRPREGMQAKGMPESEHVLLTGATGALGPYILKELSHRSNIKKITCLIRKMGKLSPMERLLHRLNVIDLDDQVNLNKVECIQGDITDDKFGLSKGEYDRLAGNVDIVINAAVRADHTGKYWKAPEGSKQDLRTVNVKGTIRILEFAVHSQLKHIFHASTVLCVYTIDDEDGDRDAEDFCDLENENGFMSEKWQGHDIFDHLPYNLGYPLSKHVAEQLCRQATERGIPCKTFRFPLIGGDSRSGRCEYRSNHLILRWLTFLKLKCVPDMYFPNMVIPVNYCAQLSLEAFFHPASIPDVYNVIYPLAGSESKSIIKIGNELGIHIKPVSMYEFVDRLKVEGDDSPIAPFMKLYRDDEAELHEICENNLLASSIGKIADESPNFFRSRNLEQLCGGYWDKYDSSEEVMRSNVQYMKDAGVFEAFGII